MDRSGLSGVIIQEACAIFADRLTAVVPSLLTADLDGVGRCLQAVTRQVLGQTVEQVMAARVAAAGAIPLACAECGAASAAHGRARARRLQGLVGDYTLRRPYYHAPAGGARAVTFNVKLPRRSNDEFPTLVKLLRLRHAGLVNQPVAGRSNHAEGGGPRHDQGIAPARRVHQ